MVGKCNWIVCLLAQLCLSTAAVAQSFDDAFTEKKSNLNNSEQADLELILQLEECKKHPQTEDCQKFFIQYAEKLNLDLDQYIIKETTPNEQQVLVPISPHVDEISEANTDNDIVHKGLLDPMQVRDTFKKSKMSVSVGGGYVPNNPMVTRFAGVLVGTYTVGKFEIYSNGTYYPDLGSNDLKGLTQKLVEIASNRSNQSNFEQPIEKSMINLNLGVGIPVLYLGGINGRSSMLTAFAGVGILSAKSYYAYSDNDVISLRYDSNKLHIPLNYGLRYEEYKKSQSVGFLTQMSCNTYRAPAPVYDPTDGEQLNKQRIYNDITASVSVIWRAK